jgi:hypothetical protein
MPKYKRKSGKPWTAVDIEQMRQMVHDNTPTRMICVRLGRTQGAVYRKASQAGISLKPPSQSRRTYRADEQAPRQQVYGSMAQHLSLFKLLVQMNQVELAQDAAAPSETR